MTRRIAAPRCLIRTVPAAVVGGVLVMIAVVATVGIGLRRRSPVVLDGLRYTSRSVINPRQIQTAGQPNAYASVIEHVGRISGRPYRTPVVVRPVEDGFVISLTYGGRADWVKNLLAAGSATLRHEGEVFDALVPEIVALDQAENWVSRGERRLLRCIGVETCLHLARPGRR